MRLRLKNKKSAFTLVELLLVIVLVSISMGAVYAFMDHSFKVSDIHRDEFYFQSDMRDTMNALDDRVKKAFVVYGVQREDFLDDAENVLAEDHYKNLNKKWKYIGVDTVKKIGTSESSVPNENYGQVCYFSYNSDTDEWEQTPLSSGDKNIVFSLEVTKKFEEGVSQKLLNYTLGGTPIINGVEKPELTRELSTQTQILNSFFVGDYGTNADKSVALAFISDQRTIPYGSITFVIDSSLGMDRKIHNAPEPPTGEPYNYYYKSKVVARTLKTMLDSLENSVNLYTSFAGFAKFGYKVPMYEASGDKVFFKKNEKNEFTDEEKNLVFDKLDPASNYKYDVTYTSIFGSYVLEKNFILGTNIGDGLRIAYTNIVDLIESAESGSSDYKDLNVKGPHYVILFTDALANDRVMAGDHIDSPPYFGDLDAFDKVNFFETGNKPMFRSGNLAGTGPLKYYRRFISGGDSNYYLHQPASSGDPSSRDRQYTIDVANYFNDDNVVTIGGISQQIPNLKSYVIFSPDGWFLSWISGQEDKVEALTQAISGVNDPYHAQDEDELIEVLRVIAYDMKKEFWQLNGPRDN